MGLMDMFKPSAAPAPSATPPSGQPTATAAPPSQPPADPNANKPGNPMDAYAKMFDNVASTEAAPALALDDKTLNDVTGSLDFAGQLPAELQTRIAAGDPKAFLEALNHVGRQSYKTALQHSTALTDKFVNVRETHTNKGFGSKVKSVLTANELAATPNFDHPVVRQQLNDTANRIQAMHPDASPQQVARMAQDYLVQLASVISPQAPQQSDSSGTGTANRDWFKYLDE